MKTIRPLWIWLGIVLTAVMIIVLTKQRVDAVHSSQLNTDSSTNARATMYVPSPYEMSMISSSKELWPRRFGPQQPPQVSDLPIIYNLFRRVHPGSGDEVEFFRSLAITSNLGEWDAFKDLLTFRLRFKNSSEVTPKRLLTWARSEKCSIFGQEIAYRVAVWSPDKIDEVRRLFEGCDPKSFQALWLKILQSQSTKDAAPLRALRDETQARRERLPTESYEFFLLSQAFAVLDLKLAHEFKQ